MMRSSRFAFLGLMAVSFASSVMTLGAQEDAPPAVEPVDHTGWLVDFDEAKTTADTEEKDILIEFTGSDWCPPCKALYANVISTDAFKEQAPEKFTLLLLDNPRDKSHQSEAEQAQYQRMAAEYGIEGVPTIMLCDAQGRPYAKMVGYGGTPVDEYIANLTTMTEKRVRRDDYLAQAEEATGVERAQLLGEALSEIDPLLCATVYRDIVDEIIELDPANDAGLKEKFTSIVNSVEIAKALRSIQMEARGGDPVAAIAKIDELIETMNPAPAQLQEILFAKGSMLFATDKAASKEALIAAQAVVPDSQIAKQIDQIMARFFADPAPGDEDGGQQN